MTYQRWYSRPGRPERCLHVLFAGSVGSDDISISAQLRARSSEGLRIRTGDDDRCTLVDEALRCREPDSCRAPGDNCDFVFHLVRHLPFLLRVYMWRVADI